MDTVPLNDLSRGFAVMEGELRGVVDEVLASGWYVLGPQHDAFETEFATAVGAAHCVGVANGTDALELALLSVDCRPGDEVVTAANAGMYTSTAALKAGLVPRFADVDPASLLLTAATVEPALSPRTRAVVVTHLYGRVAEMGPLRELCRSAGVALVEDCAQSAGARAEEGPAGSLADVASFSFFPTKNLGALGDAGAVVTDDPDRAQLLRSLRQYGWSAKYHATVPRGRNSRLDELQAAVLRARLPHLAGWNERRREIVGRYAAALGEGPRRMVHGDVAASPAYVAHLAVMSSPTRDADRAALTDVGIRTDVHYPVPDHRQPVLAGTTDGVSLPVTELAATQILTLPCFAELTDAEIERVCDVLHRL
ncbi:DegT/DnrJ/EryC1/StrS family aminotransferase [Modestobacter roseus]|uniref:dTDP-4-amino-4,6-dideoxygalactose transaminase n=1 Tax=Modestobacter roseus TaxID=1181884 RepID=A0A562IT94_9ACTN|nr:DegT/DnrJ/EryC1/StrS family aminotransferase [Modestobacter roseus]MQA33315.1 erythromycin biosynthesis sensory transduction protein eryC1 [Modestobacter roseus]TWH74241.1 dTDP-4-amino-4,6-dideoxygalactose transaminase [Modestobacter roseus]